MRFNFGCTLYHHHPQLFLSCVYFAYLTIEKFRTLRSTTTHFSYVFVVILTNISRVVAVIPFLFSVPMISFTQLLTNAASMPPP